MRKAGILLLTKMSPEMDEAMRVDKSTCDFELICSRLKLIKGLRESAAKSYLAWVEYHSVLMSVFNRVLSGDLPPEQRGSYLKYYEWSVRGDALDGRDFGGEDSDSENEGSNADALGSFSRAESWRDSRLIFEVAMSASCGGILIINKLETLFTNAGKNWREFERNTVDNAPLKLADKARLNWGIVNKNMDELWLVLKIFSHECCAASIHLDFISQITGPMEMEPEMLAIMCSLLSMYYQILYLMTTLPVYDSSDWLKPNVNSWDKQAKLDWLENLRGLTKCIRVVKETLEVVKLYQGKRLYVEYENIIDALSKRADALAFVGELVMCTFHEIKETERAKHMEECIYNYEFVFKNSDYGQKDNFYYFLCKWFGWICEAMMSKRKAEKSEEARNLRLSGMNLYARGINIGTKSMEEFISSIKISLLTPGLEEPIHIGV